ncbi:cell wall / vacuolar inhibitor of fructosidase 2-like [Benincasa hispida]|uniref:cell wall / vacuolar inhibitor of fructosidase 2-like n=1 Tax=Benincasa hispida TaxID=102211 RepID=UPI001901685A|nr:cell wall / vacuolar inhibitor of fructosidase 2-like [Benincasa hispida]
MKFVSAILFVLCLSMVAQRLDAASPAEDGLSMIDHMCAQTNYKDLCVISLTSDPNSFPADKMGLALVALRFASSNASDISESIKVMLNDTSLNKPSVQQGLFDCLDEYLDASQQLDDAIAAILVKAYGDVEKWVDAAIASVRTCENEFATKPSLLAPKNDVFIKLCEIALSISKVADTAEGN